MKKKIITLSCQQNRLMWDALRRIVCFSISRNVDTNLAGLGTPSVYKAGIEGKLFSPSFGKETPRVNNWYKLTPIGVKIAKQMIKKGIVPKSCHDVNGQLPCHITIMV